MRVTEGLITEKFLYYKNKVSSKKMKLQNQLANNSKIDTLSDDLSGSLESIKFATQIKKTETFSKNAESAKDFMTSTLRILEYSTDEMQKIISATQSSVNALNTSNYGTIAQSIKDSLSAIVQSMSSKQNDMYFFGGTDYSAPPFAIDANGRAVVTSANISGEVKVQVTQNIKDTINIPGSKIVATGVFDAINAIIDSLEAGATPSDALINNLESAYKEMLNVQSLGGERMNRIEDINEVLKNQKENLLKLLAKKQEIDPAELLVDLQHQDYLLQVSYKLLANSFPKSIFDYI